MFFSVRLKFVLKKLLKYDYIPMLICDVEKSVY